MLNTLWPRKEKGRLIPQIKECPDPYAWAKEGEKERNDEEKQE